MQRSPGSRGRSPRASTALTSHGCSRIGDIPDVVAAGGVQPGQDETKTSLALRSAGFVYDRISPSMLARSTADTGVLTVGSARYSALLLSGWDAANPGALDAALAAVRAGVPVVVLGTLPSRARGLTDASARDARVAASVAAIGPLAHVVGATSDSRGCLRECRAASRSVAAVDRLPVLTVRRREMSGQHIVFVFNEQRTACSASLSFGFPVRTARVLDPRPGSRPGPPGHEQRRVAHSPRQSSPRACPAVVPVTAFW